MKVFSLLLVAVALCSTSSATTAENKKSDKKVKKRGLLELGTVNFGNIYNPSYAAPSVPAFQALAAPFIPSPQLIPETNTFVHTPHPLSAEQGVPTQVKTFVKHVHIPYERFIRVDNPIYTPFERFIRVDNPIPVLKIIKKPVPVHIEQPIPIPIVKEIREPQPYTHRVRLVVQEIFVKNQEAPNTYLPPTASPNLPAPPSSNYETPQQFAQPASASAPANNYIPPAQNFEAPAASTSYSASQSQNFDAPSFSSHQQSQFDNPSPSNSYVPPPQQHFDTSSTASTQYGPPQKFNRSI